MRSKVRLLRIETRMTRTGAPAIADFLHWATVDELWVITPPLSHELPDNLKRDYTLIGSRQGLLVLYSGCEGLIIPMLQKLLERWQLIEPTKVAAVISECSQFIQHQRARTQRDATLTQCDAVYSTPRIEEVSAMPREVLVQWIADPSLTGHPTGSTALRYGIDADELCARGMCVIIDEHPAPRNYLLSDGVFDVGVMSGSQTKMTEEQRKSEQQFLLDQVKNLDAKHEEQLEQQRLKDAIANKRKEVSRG